MSWKDELVTAVNKLKDKPLGLDPIGIGITGDRMDFDLLLPHWEKVNSHPIAWVGPGYLMLSQVEIKDDSSWMVFLLSPERKHNQVIIQDFTGQIARIELPFYDPVDFLSL